MKRVRAFASQVFCLTGAMLYCSHGFNSSILSMVHFPVFYNIFIMFFILFLYSRAQFQVYAVYTTIKLSTGIIIGTVPVVGRFFSPPTPPVITTQPTAPPLFTAIHGPTAPPAYGECKTGLITSPSCTPSL